MPKLLEALDGALVFKGDGDYDVRVGDVTIELSYDGSDHAVGTWQFWNVRIGDQRFGGTSIIGPGAFHDWLEAQARDDQGHLPVEVGDGLPRWWEAALVERVTS